MQMETLNLSWEMHSVRSLIAEFWKRKQTCETQAKSVGKACLSWEDREKLSTSASPVVTVLRLSSHLPPFRDMAPLFLTQLLELWRWWITILGAGRNVECRIYFPNVTHTSWGDAGLRLCSSVRKIQGKGLVCPVLHLLVQSVHTPNVDKYTNWFNKLYLSSLYNFTFYDVPQVRNTA